MTDTEIMIGLGYQPGADEAIAGTGAKASTGDQRRYYEIMLDYINRTGGVAGRKVTPVYFAADGGSSTQSNMEAACSTWTEDHEVFAVVTWFSSATLQQCLHNKGQVALHVYPLGTSDDVAFESFPLWVEAATFSLNPMARTYVTGLDEQGFFDDPDLKLGLVRSERPAFERATEHDLKPALAELGIVIEEEATAQVEGLGDLGPGSSTMANIVLQFKTAGITNVIFFEPWIGYALFMQQAESQDYRPRYGLNSMALPQIMIETGIVPMEQFQDSLLVGWLTNFDVQKFEGTWPTLQECQDIYEQAGVTFADRNARGVGLYQCDHLLLFREAMTRAPGPIDGMSLIRGAEAIGSELELASTGGGRLAPDRHWGVAEYRHASFDDACPCFQYTSAAKPLS